MKNCIILFFCFLFGFEIYSQVPVEEWSQFIGTSGNDDTRSVVSTPDGGCLVLGTRSSSFDGDATCFNGLSDIWLFKFNSLGAIEWQRCYGGSHAEEGRSIINVGDDYLIVGTANSEDGDLTSHYGPNSLGDIWVIKIDSEGNILWQRTYGGSSSDWARAVIATSDGGFVIGGMSNSTNHDVSGFHPGEGFDYWVFKINSTGVLQWQICLGGSDQEYLFDLIQITTGEFIIAGDSRSVDGDVTGLHTTYAPDMWIVKLSASGNLIWQKCFGGSGDDQCYSLIQSGDNAIILAGKTSSYDGDVSEMNGYYDGWLVEIDFDGNLISDKCIGESGEELFSSIIENNGEFVLSGEKQMGCVGSCDYYIVNIDEDLNLIWDKCVGTLACDAAWDISKTDDGFYVTGNLYADDSASQFYVVKLGDGCLPSPELCNSLDDNCNGLIDDAITETISITAGGPISFCQGGSVLLTATYSGASVQWKKNGTNIPGATSATYNAITKGNYSCVTTSACGTAESTPIFVNVIKNPNASISAGGPTTFCAGGSVVLTEVAVAGCTYQWYKGATPIAGATSFTYTATTSGNYKCRVTKAATGCFKNSNAIAVSVPCREGLSAGEVGEMFNDKNTFSIYPNPNNGTFTIEATVTTQNFASPESTIEIYNNLGQLIFSKKVIANDGIINEAIELKNITPGIYLVKLWNNNIYNVKNIIIE
jgi:hypothetical protein